MRSLSTWGGLQAVSSGVRWSCKPLQGEDVERISGLVCSLISGVECLARFMSELGGSRCSGWTRSVVVVTPAVFWGLPGLWLPSWLFRIGSDSCGFNWVLQHPGQKFPESPLRRGWPVHEEYSGAQVENWPPSHVLCPSLPSLWAFCFSYF